MSVVHEVATGLAPMRHADTSWLRAILMASPAEHVFVASLLDRSGTAAMSSADGHMLGFYEGGQPVAAYWLGTTIVPVAASPTSNSALAEYLNARGRRMCSFVGEARAVLDLASRVDWGEPRKVRPRQILMAALGTPVVPADRSICVAPPAWEAEVYAASVVMFEEELGFSPLERGGSAYRQRVASLLSTGQTFASTTVCDPAGGPIRHWPSPDTDRQVVFKADAGICSRTAVQVQGVWVHPDFRGRGIATRAMVQTTALIKERIAPLVTLYVNDFNDPARRAYRKAGFVDVGCLATVMY